MTFVLLQASLFQCHISPYVDLMHTAFRRTGSHFGLIVNSLRFCAPPILRFRTNLKRRRVDWLVFPLLQALQNFLRWYNDRWWLLDVIAPGCSSHVHPLCISFSCWGGISNGGGWAGPARRLRIVHVTQVIRRRPNGNVSLRESFRVQVCYSLGKANKRSSRGV